MVGFHPRGFDRLVNAMDHIAGEIDEEVVIQMGNTDYNPQHADSFRFKGSDEEIDDVISRARIVVAHSGVGTILKALHQGKAIIVVPRLRELGEHVDDHQDQIAKRLSQVGLVRIANEPIELKRIILGEDFSDSNDSIQPESVERSRLLNSLRHHIQSLSR